MPTVFDSLHLTGDAADREARVQIDEQRWSRKREKCRVAGCLSVCVGNDDGICTHVIGVDAAESVHCLCRSGDWIAVDTPLIEQRHVAGCVDGELGLTPKA